MTKPYLLLNDDCLNALKKFPDNSIEAVCTDPPYGLSKQPDIAEVMQHWINGDVYEHKSNGFMGKSWDSFVPGPEYWREVLRVLKPGGHAVVFAGSRTQDLMSIALRFAGFEIRETIMWVYGCLSEDTEILTDDGWCLYNRNLTSKHVLCYDISSDSFCFAKPSRAFIYENKHPAYRIESDSTDQLVSRNHRCIVERDGRKVFAYAETCKQQESVPFLESLRDLPETIPYLHKGTSYKKEDLLKVVSKQDNKQPSDWAKNAARKEVGNLDNLSCVRESSVEEELTVEESRNPSMFKAVQWKTKIVGACKAFTQKLAWVGRRGKEKESIGSNERGEKLGLEGWGKLSASERKLRWREVCSLPVRLLSTYGKEGWLRSRTQVGNGTTSWSTIGQGGSGSSYRPRPKEQRFGESDAVQEQRRTQKVRRTRATFTEVEYKGKVWCVEVPTGAFVARRNGKIFITGNSGMPKSHAVDKAIDKCLGAEREVVGIRKHPTLKDTSKIDRQGNHQFNGTNTIKDEWELTAPATNEAKQWQGWGSALKPAYEPIILVRKPLEGTIAQNVLKWGCGGINIDECRVELASEADKAQFEFNHAVGTRLPEEYADKKLGLHDGGWMQQVGEKETPTGRWPANICHDGSDEVVEMFPHTKSGKDVNPTDKPVSGFFGSTMDYYSGTNYGDSGSAARFFYSSKATKKDRGEGNNHPTVKPVKLMEWLVKMVTPKNGKCLDPFMGSGSTGVAALNTGRKFIGIEMDSDYYQIAQKRIEEAVDSQSK